MFRKLAAAKRIYIFVTLDGSLFIICVHNAMWMDNGIWCFRTFLKHRVPEPP